MTIQTKDLQEACKSILGAVDTDSALKNVAFGYDTLEVEASGKVLNLNVTNGEYYVNVSLALDNDESFRAVVDAKLFLALISKVTTSAVEMTTTDNVLVVQANGKYQFPLKYDIDEMVVLPKIVVNNPTANFVVQSATLVSILDNNSREVNPGATMPAMKFYYLDQEGCLTFTNVSACVNSFTLPTTMKIMMTPKLVKLFKLFKDGDVSVTLGFEDVNGVAQARIVFKQDNVSITSILPNDASLVSSVPVVAIRGRVYKVFDNNVSFDKKYFLEAIDRLLLFDTTNSLNRGIGVFEFNEDSVDIFDSRRSNDEVIAYASGVCANKYTCCLDLEAIKTILLSTDSQVFNLSFGDNQSVVISFGNIRNVIAQRVLR